jgi:hypothetical protein
MTIVPPQEMEWHIRALLQKGDPQRAVSFDECREWAREFIKRCDPEWTPGTEPKCGWHKVGARLLELMPKLEARMIHIVCDAATELRE